MAFKQRAPMRIRNISPKVFQNYELDDAEKQSGLPIFKTLTGLWCHADREGRFAWDLRKLQIHIHPFRPETDIAAILNILLEQEIVRQYVVDGKTYGWLVTFKEYQYLSNNEPPSALPSPELDEGSQSVLGADSEESESARPDKRRLTSDNRQQTKDGGRLTTDDRRLTGAGGSSSGADQSRPAPECLTDEKQKQSGQSQHNQEPYIPRAQADRVAPFSTLTSKYLEADIEFMREVRQLAGAFQQVTGQRGETKHHGLYRILYEHGAETAIRVLDWAWNRSDYWFKTEKGQIKGIAGFSRAFDHMFSQWQKMGCPETVAETVAATPKKSGAIFGAKQLAPGQIESAASGLGLVSDEELEETETLVMEDFSDL
jgi:hypothetical protein